MELEPEHDIQVLGATYTKHIGEYYRMTLRTPEALKLSRKGNLVYDSSWYTDGRVHETIMYCTSPPEISSELSGSVLQELSFSEREDKQNLSDNSEVFLWPFCRRRSYGNVREKSYSSNESSSTLQKPGTSYRELELNDIQSVKSSAQTGLVEVSILECQQLWDELSKKRAHERRHDVEEHSNHLLEQAEKSSVIFNEQQDEKKRVLLQNMQHIQQENEELRQQRLQHQQDRYRLHVKRMEVKLKTALQKKAEAEVEAEHSKRIAERQAYLESVMNVHKQIDESSRKVFLQLDKYKHRHLLPPDVEEIKKSMKQITKQAEHLVNDAKQRGASMDLVESMHKIIESLMVHQEYVSKIIAETDRLVQEDIARKAREASVVQQQAITHATTSASTSVLPVSSQGNSGSTVHILQKAISAEALRDYETLQNQHKAVICSYQTLAKTTDPQLKKYRFDLQKAVNVPINAISNQSGAHLLDKLQRLKCLLSGKTVDVSGKKVSVSQNAEGKAFMKDLLAKKIVKQSDEQVSSNHESAFPIAAVAVSLWRDFPDVGKLILAHFYLKCPFLLPYHITKNQDQSNEEYYRSLGYNYESDGTIEKQDKYLRRMSGFMRLYAAMIVTQPIQNSSQAHPHGIDNAWMWLARLLNMEPQPDITATMLFDLLEVCGYALAAVYSRQFFKLIQVICKDYLPKIEDVTPKGSGGPVMRLKTFLETVIRTQRVAQPKGKLQSDFWRT